MSGRLYTRTAFGLRWQLPFECLEMATAIIARADAGADVTVRYGAVPDRLEGASGAGPFQQVMAREVLFGFPGVARYWIREGREIVIEREEGAPQDEVRLFLLGTVASLLLHQRDLLPIHASGIHTARGAVLFAGHSGTGKSTLLAAFLARGYAMLTDDLAAIELDDGGCPHVHPGYPQFKLWADSAEILRQPTNGLRRVRTEIEKYAVPLQDDLHAASAPLRAIYLPIVHQEASLRLEPLHDARKFNVFLDHTWQKLALKRMGRHADHFRQAVAVANAVSVSRVYRPAEPFLVQELADLIETDFNA